jgi:hypothetical protein
VEHRETSRLRDPETMRSQPDSHDIIAHALDAAAVAEADALFVSTDQNIRRLRGLEVARSRSGAPRDPETSRPRDHA